MFRFRRAALAATMAAALTTLAVVPAGAQRGPFSVGAVTAAPGTAASGRIVVPAGVDSGTFIPVTVIHGTRPGPVLALIAGTHGSEVAPIVALQRLRPLVDAATLRGTLVLVHVANVPSYLHRTVYRGPWDGQNLNRMYPGRADGTVSQRIAHAITTEIIAKCDYLVDMHAGDGNESLRPYTYAPRIGVDARVDSLALQMALAFGNDHLIIDTERPRDPARSVYTQSTAHLRGKPAITTETGGMGVALEEYVARNVDGAQRLMRWLQMLDGPVQRVEAPIWLHSPTVVASPGTGTWIARVEKGQSVAAGTVLGVVTDLTGADPREVRSPVDGIVMYVIGTPAMSQGEPVAMVARRGQPPASP